MSCKYSQKFLDHTKQIATNSLKIVSKKAIQKTLEATAHLISIKIAGMVQSGKIPKISKTSQQFHSEIFPKEHDKEIS